MLAAVAALAVAMPARADLVYEFRLATDQTDPSNGAWSTGSPAAIPAGPAALTGTQGSPWVVQPNQDYILQIVLRQTDAAQPAFANVNPTPGSPGTGQKMISYGFRLNYLPGVFQHVAPITNYFDTTSNPPGDINTYGVGTAGFQSDPNPNGSDATSTALRDLTTGNGYFQASGIYPLANVRMHTGNSGSGRLVITDPDAGQSNGSPSNPTMDAGIFDQALSSPLNTASGTQNNGFELFFQVQAVPEPSSMVLAGLGLAGLGYRLRRKKAAQAA